MLKPSNVKGIALIFAMLLILAGCSKNDAGPSPQAEAPGSQSSQTQPEPEEEEIHDDFENFIAFRDLLAKSIDVTNVYYEYELRVAGVSREYYSAWIDQDRIRLEPFEQRNSLYADLNEKSVKVHFYDTNVIAPAAFEENFFQSMMSPVAFREVLEQDMFEHVHFEGSALVDGKPCDVFEVHAADLNVTYYLWKENGLAVKMIAQITGFPAYEYYFRSLEPGGAEADALIPPADASPSSETVSLPSLKVGK